MQHDNSSCTVCAILGCIAEDFFMLIILFVAVVVFVVALSLVTG